MSRAIAASRAVAACTLAAVAALALSGTVRAETWRGLTVAPEHRCSPYDRNRAYRYPQSIEREIVRRLGAVYGPYTGTCFSSTSETDIEHMVATSEAHDSGLCAADRATRARFATDLRNLTLASPGLNRHRKSGKDAGEWLPERNRCWFAARVIEVRRAWEFTIDRREADTLERDSRRLRAPRWNRWSVTHRPGMTPTGGPSPCPTVTATRSLATTTAASPARTRAATASPRFAAITRRTATCVTGMATGSCASERLGDKLSAAESAPFAYPMTLRPGRN